MHKSSNSIRSRSHRSNNNSGGGRRRFNSRFNSNNRGRSRGRYNNRRQNVSPQRGKEMYTYTPTPTTSEEEEYKGTAYAQLNLSDAILRNLDKKGFKYTTEIQDKCIPLILNGKNVLGISRTGSGKTGAFLISMIQKLANDPDKKLMVIAPTRELAKQISKEAVSIVRGLKMNVSTLIGGENMFFQKKQLQRGQDIIIGTPGRIKDFMQQGIIQYSNINNIIIDEVDRMLDMGFIDDIKFIFREISPEKQALFFSATHNNTVERIVKSMVSDFELIKLDNNKPNENVHQSTIEYKHLSEKIDLLQELLQKQEVEKTIIFVETKRFADQIESILYKERFKVGVIHGDKRQNFRKRMIQKFRRSNINHLVATNVAARGIDIDDITHVINLDEPKNYDEYIHRIGRTGRNGKSGAAYTFIKSR